jgi:hypothetical protein
MSTKYQMYLRCDCWMKQIRQQALVRASYVCQAKMRCSGASAREVHHLSYASIGNEGPFDTLAVCPECHQALHGIAAKPRKPPANDNNPPVSNAQLALDLFGAA